MHNTTKNNLMTLIILTLSISPIVAMEKEVEKNVYAQKKVYKEKLSQEIDTLLEKWDKKSLNALILKNNKPAEDYVIDNDLSDLLQKPCNRRDRHSLNCTIHNAQSLAIETEHCEPSEITFNIEPGTSCFIDLRPTFDKKLQIVCSVISPILNETIRTQLGYNAISKGLLAQLQYDAETEKICEESGRSILKEKMMTKLEYNHFFDKVLGELQIIYPYYLMTIENKSGHTLFLNAKNPSSLTSLSPYAFVERNTTKKFLISEEQKDHQTITFPNASNTIELPINTQKPHFIIENSNIWNAAVINAISTEKIGKLTYNTCSS